MTRHALLCLGFTVALAGCGASDDPVTTVPDSSAPETVAEAAPDVVETTVQDAAEVDAVEPTDVRQADSHVHGAANLAMALDGNVLSVELESPLYNILGFEHAPDTKAQETAVAKAEAALRTPSNLFAFTSASGCNAVPVAPVTLFEADEDDDHSHDHDHDHADDHSHDHDDEHDHHDEHGHNEDHEGEGHEHAHKDVIVAYSFLCDNAARVEWMETTLFDRFTAMEQLDLVYLGPETPISETVTRETGRISLTR